METRKRVRVPDFKEKKQRGEKIADAHGVRRQHGAAVRPRRHRRDSGRRFARHVIMGYETTLPVTLDVMVHHTRAVSRGTRGRWWSPTCRSSVPGRRPGGRAQRRAAACRKAARRR